MLQETSSMERQERAIVLLLIRAYPHFALLLIFQEDYTLSKLIYGGAVLDR